MGLNDRRIIRLPFGEGLQRSDGVMVVAPNSFDDLREVYQFNGKAQVRKGLSQVEVLVDDVAVDLDMTLALSPLRAESAALGIGFDNATKEIWANRLAIDGTNATNLGLFGTLAVTATWDPPIIILADTDGRCLITHDEPNLNSRLVTKYYDPIAAPALQTLQADLDGNGDADVYFRGVVRHLSYIFGWGYGNATPGSQDRADVVRVSTAGNPTLFRDDAFFEVGQRQEPVMVCRPAGDFLVVFKETESYQIFGYSPDTFGIKPADTLYGCVSSRLAVSVGGVVFFWSTQGPRYTQGGQSQDIAVPLDIGGPDPATLAAEADVQNAFAEYDPVTRVVVFVWGQRVYALSIRDPSKPRWSYYEIGETLQCGAQFFTTQSSAGGGGQPADGPVFDAITPVPTIGDTNLGIDWDNTGATGGEVIEIWKRVSPAGPWGKHTEVVTTLVDPQLHPLTGLIPDTDYDLAIRYRRGGLYNPGATNTGDPTTWPVAAQTSVTTLLGVPAPVSRGDNNGLWEVTGASTEQITVNWTIPAGHETLLIEVERAIGTEGDSTTQAIGGVAIGPPDTGGAQAFGAFSALASSPLPAGTTQLVDTAITVHQWHRYRWRFVGGVAWSSLLDCFAGPDAPQTDAWSAVGDGLLNYILLEWANATTPTGRTSCPGPTAAPGNHSTLAYANNMTLNPSSDGWAAGLTGDVELPYGTLGGITIIPTPAGDGTTVRVGLRHRVTCFGTQYPSYWARFGSTPNYIVTTAGTTE